MGLKEAAKLLTDEPLREKFKQLPIDRQQKLQREVLFEIVNDPQFQTLVKQDSGKAQGLFREVLGLLPIPIDVPTAEGERIESPEEGMTIMGALTNPGVLLQPENLAAGFGAGFMQGSGVAGRLGSGVRGAIEAGTLIPAVTRGAKGLAKGILKGFDDGPTPLPPTTSGAAEAPPVAFGEEGVAELQAVRRSTPEPTTEPPPTAKAPPQDDLQAQSTADEILGGVEQPRLKLEAERRINDAALDLFEQGLLEHVPNQRIMVQITNALSAGKISIDDLKQRGVSVQDIGQLAESFHSTGSFAARYLADWSRVSRNLNKILQRNPDPELEEELRRVGSAIDEGMAGRSIWRRLDGVRRGLLVTQLSTAVRNAETQITRLGVAGLTDAVDVALQRALGVAPTKSATDGFETILRIFQKGTKADVEDIMKHFPAERDRLFLRFSSDISSKLGEQGIPLGPLSQAITKAEQATHALNIFNRFQEFAIRRGIIHASLDQQLKRSGSSLAEAIKNPSLLDDSMVQKAVDKALEITFAEEPKFGSIGHAFVNFINKMPGATLLIPFPRFLVNSTKFLFEHSPLGLTRLLSPTQLKALAAGDTAVASKGIVGSALLMTAWQIRNSEFAGERWYELKTPDGTIVDTRPFNPFAAYLFVADVLKRKKEDRLDTFTTKDIAMGILSSNVRAGTGLFLVDQTLDAFVAMGNEEKATERLKELTGEIVGGLFTPINQISDIVSEFDESLRVVRETKDAPLTGPTLSRIRGIPILGDFYKKLPEAESPTRSGPLMRQAPLLRQVTGFGIVQPRTPIEEELERHGFRRSEILPPTGNRKFDRLIAKHMGPLVETIMPPFLEEKGYQQMPERGKAVALEQAIKLIYGEAKDLARKELDGQDLEDVVMKDKAGKLSKRIKLLLRAKGAKL